MPPGSVHSFSNPGTKPVRFLIQMSLGGTEGYFTALSEMVQNAPSWPLPDIWPVTAPRNGSTPSLLRSRARAKEAPKLSFGADKGNY